MIPVALVTGFLGSGKTTFLRHVAQRYHDRKLIYLVNEFSPLDVDAQLLLPDAPDVLALPGGSIFCQCRVTDFIKMLADIPERFHAPGAPVDGVVIEASGIADPRVVERMLRETHLDDLYALASIVCIVDPASFPALVRSLPNITAQVEASDFIVLNKIDLFEPMVVREAEEEIERIRPGAPVLHARYCEVDVDLFGKRGERGMEGAYAPCADPNYARFCVRLKNELALAPLKAALLAHRDVLYRAKGFLRAEGQGFYLDYSPAALTLRPVMCPPDDARLVFVARAAAADAVRNLVGRLKCGDFDAVAP